MIVPTVLHLMHERFVPRMQCGEFADPAKRLGMSRVARLSQDEDVPQAVQLAMFAE
jgi:hypothetical protein